MANVPITCFPFESRMGTLQQACNPKPRARSLIGAQRGSVLISSAITVSLRKAAVGQQPISGAIGRPWHIFQYSGGAFGAEPCSKTPRSASTRRTVQIEFGTILSTAPVSASSISFSDAPPAISWSRCRSSSSNRDEASSSRWYFRATSSFRRLNHAEKKPSAATSKTAVKSSCTAPHIGPIGRTGMKA